MHNYRQLMINFNTFTLKNGLQVIVHRDASTPMAVLNILYKVGSRNETPEKTGFAHLFEHLMFEGSVNIPHYDTELQKVGGDNNAFTSPDVTNYYLSVPAVNIETGFWLESDRMLKLAFSEEKLKVQKNVVIEEFKQRYLNQPYGDVWHQLRPLAYKSHPYQWPTIGKQISHIEEATLNEVENFFNKWYNPANAILVVSGNVTTEQVKDLSEKWFAGISSHHVTPIECPAEPTQTQPRSLTTTGNVPQNAIYMAWHGVKRLSPQYHALDLVTDVLSQGSSSRLYNRLVKDKEIFSHINCFHTGSIDKGLVIIGGLINDEVSTEVAENAIWTEIDDLVNNGVTADELLKVKNQAESSLIFSEVEMLNRSYMLALGNMLGDTDYINKEPEKIRNVTQEQIQTLAKELFKREKTNTLYYNKKTEKLKTD